MLAASSAGLAVSAHVLADGDLPDIGLTTLLALLIGWTSASLAERFGAGIRGAIGQFLVLAFGQLMMHLVLGELAGHPSAHPRAHPVADSPDAGKMFGLHVAATVLTALIIRKAESVLGFVVASLNRLVPRLYHIEPVDSTIRDAGRVPVATSLSTLISTALRRIYTRRGPPISFFAIQ